MKINFIPNFAIEILSGLPRRARLNPNGFNRSALRANFANAKFGFIILFLGLALINSASAQELEETGRGIGESKINAEKLKAMDFALMQAAEKQAILEISEAKTTIDYGQKERFTTNAIFQILGLILVPLLGFLFWRRYKLTLNKNAAIQEIAKLKLELEGKNKLLEHEEIIRKTIEHTSLAREKEFEELKLELQKEATLLERKEKIHKILEDELSKKTKEYERIKNSLEDLKNILVEKGLANRLISNGEEQELWISGKSEERRKFPRLFLTRDFNNTIILRIELQNMPNVVTQRSYISASRLKTGEISRYGIKCFAKNISSEGLCLETRKEFNEREKINLRLFFFGDKIPMMRIKAEVIWKKILPTVNYYGLFFIVIEEKTRLELNRYIERKLRQR